MLNYTGGFLSKDDTIDSPGQSFKNAPTHFELKMRLLEKLWPHIFKYLFATVDMKHFMLYCSHRLPFFPENAYQVHSK